MSAPTSPASAAGAESWPAFAGIDWGRSHHQLCILDTTGKRQSQLRVTHDVAGLADLVDEQDVADGDLLLATTCAHNRVHVSYSLSLRERSLGTG